MLFILLLYLLIILLSHSMNTIIDKYHQVCNSTNNNNNYTLLYGKTAIVTGANSGVGFYAALELASRGARVILACRDWNKASAARRRIIDETQNSNIVICRLDLASLTSVREFCKLIIAQEEYIHYVINNAGAIQLGNHVTADDLQITWQVNYFSPFLLTNLLLEKLEKSQGSIINVTGKFCSNRTSLTDMNCYWSANNVIVSDLIAYFNAKSALYEFTGELARRSFKINVHNFNVNWTSSNFWRRVYLGPIALVYLILHVFFSRPEDKGKRLVNTLLSEKTIFDEHEHEHEELTDSFLAEELWKRSCYFVNISV